MSARRDNSIQKSIPGQPYQDQKEVVPCIEQDLQGLPVTFELSWQGERETIFGDLLSRRIRTQHPKGRKSTGQVYEGQTAEYCGTGVR